MAGFSVRKVSSFQINPPRIAEEYERNVTSIIKQEPRTILFQGSSIWTFDPIMVPVNMVAFVNAWMPLNRTEV